MEHYLDNAATTKPCAEAAAAVMSCISSHYGNPSSLHRKGLEAQHEVEYARNQVAGALGCKAQEIVFTSGATESTNLALCGAAAAYGRKRKKIITSAVEHASVRETMAHLETLGEKVGIITAAALGIHLNRQKRLPPVELRKQHEQHLQTFTENRDLVKSRLQRQSQILRQSRRHSSLM